MPTKEAIREEMNKTRTRVQNDLGDVTGSLREKLSWRYYVRSRPRAFLLGAAWLGWWLVPVARKQHQVQSPSKPMAAVNIPALTGTSGSVSLKQRLLDAMISGAGALAVRAAPALLSALTRRTNARQPREKRSEVANTSEQKDEEYRSDRDQYSGSTPRYS